MSLWAATPCGRSWPDTQTRLRRRGPNGSSGDLGGRRLPQQLVWSGHGRARVPKDRHRAELPEPPRHLTPVWSLKKEPLTPIRENKRTGNPRGSAGTTLTAGLPPEKQAARVCTPTSGSAGPGWSPTRAGSAPAKPRPSRLTVMRCPRHPHHDSRPLWTAGFWGNRQGWSGGQVSFTLATWLVLKLNDNFLSLLKKQIS